MAAALAVLSQLAACGLVRGSDPAVPPSRSTPASASGRSPSESEFEREPTDLPPNSALPSASLAPGCYRGDPRAGVNTPLRLIVRSPCLTVHGTAGCIYTDHGDGDTHVALLLDDDESKYLTLGNAVWTCGTDQGSDTAPRMVVEIIPQHCTVRPDNCADRGHFTSPDVPANGQRITVTGAWVLDTSTRQGVSLWAEIHPAMRIVVDD